MNIRRCTVFFCEKLDNTTYFYFGQRRVTASIVERSQLDKYMLVPLTNFYTDYCLPAEHSYFNFSSPGLSSCAQKNTQQYLLNVPRISIFFAHLSTEFFTATFHFEFFSPISIFFHIFQLKIFHINFTL